ncbi:MAG: hypothetical protein HC836_43925 [Richelia sp. RM2_1_2]|nr:hypothetical protein [Richelia sp. RM2_1_2]
MTQLLLDDILQQIKQEIEIDAQGRGKASIRATAFLSGCKQYGTKKSF